nr:cell division protein FtsQ/DivIB [uncultured Roseateles sp.]
MRAATSTHDIQLPPDVRLMNGVSALLFTLVAVAVLALLMSWVARLPVFGVRAIKVDGEVSRNSVASLRANALPRLQGNFFTMNLAAGRQAFEAVPWVRHAVVQRVWPNRLLVSLEEHHAAAYWEGKVEGANADSDAAEESLLVNTQGEVFQANLGDVEDENLPVLSGPQGTAPHMLSLWQRLNAAVAPLEDSVERLDLSGRGSWRIKMERGAVVELGRGSDDEVLQRLSQFVRTVTQITSQYQRPLESADLRHADGYAVHLRGVSTTTGPVGPVKKR